MKLVMPMAILAVVACSSAAKLDRTYLPPPGANIAGGSPGSLSAPHGPHYTASNGGQGSPGYPGSPGTTGHGQFSTKNSAQGEPGHDLGAQAGTSRPSASKYAFQGSNQAQSGSVAPDYGFDAQAPSAPNYGSHSAVKGSSIPTYDSQRQSGDNFGAQGSPTTAFGSRGDTQATPSGGSSGKSFGSHATNTASSPQSQSGSDGVRNFDQGTDSSNQNFRPDYESQAHTQPERAQAAEDRAAETLRYDTQIDGDSYSYSFETSNGIAAEESGVATNGVQAQGGFSYTGDDGQHYSITYTADENGFQPSGDHLPTPPPIPEEILRSIEENARAAAAGTQEGAYIEEEYEANNSPNYNTHQPGSSDQQYNQGSQSFDNGPSRQYGAPSAQNQPHRPSSDTNFDPSVNSATSGGQESHKPSDLTHNGKTVRPSGASGSQFKSPSSFNQYSDQDQQNAGSHGTPSSQQRPSLNNVGSSATGYRYNRPGFDSQSSQTTDFGSRVQQQHQAPNNEAPNAQASKFIGFNSQGQTPPGASSFDTQYNGPSSKDSQTRPGFSSTFQAQKTEYNTPSTQGSKASTFVGSNSQGQSRPGASSFDTQYNGPSSKDSQTRPGFPSTFQAQKPEYNAPSTQGSKASTLVGSNSQGQSRPGASSFDTQYNGPSSKDSQTRPGFPSTVQAQKPEYNAPSTQGSKATKFIGSNSQGQSRPGASSFDTQYNGPSSKDSQTRPGFPSTFQPQKPAYKAPNTQGSGRQSSPTTFNTQNTQDSQYSRPDSASSFDDKRNQYNYPSPDTSSSFNTPQYKAPSSEDSRVTSRPGATIFNSPNGQHPPASSESNLNYNAQSQRPDSSQFENTDTALPNHVRAPQPPSLGVTSTNTKPKNYKPSSSGFPGAPYQYNPPKDGTFSTPDFVPLGSKNVNSSKGEEFGGPRQPPSFSPEEGYKY